MEGILLAGKFAEALNVPKGRAGYLVQRVAQDSPSDRLGIRGGSIPVAIGGQALLIGGDVIVEAFGIRLEGIALLMAVDRLRDMVSTWGNVVIQSLGACTVNRVIRGPAAAATGESA